MAEAILELDLSDAYGSLDDLSDRFDAIVESFSANISDALSGLDTDGLAEALNAAAEDFATNLSNALSDASGSGLGDSLDAAAQSFGEAITGALNDTGAESLSSSLDTAATDFGSGLTDALDSAASSAEDLSSILLDASSGFGDQLGGEANNAASGLHNLSGEAVQVGSSLVQARESTVSAEGGMRALDAGTSTLKGSFGGLITAVIPAAATFAGLGVAIAGLVELGDQAQLSVERMNAVFGDNAPAVFDQKVKGVGFSLSELDAGTGTSDTKMRGLLATFGQTAIGAGATSVQAASAAREMGVLDGIVTALNPNLGSADQNFQLLSRGLGGSTRILQRYGLTVDQTAQSELALSIAHENGRAKASLYDKQMAGLQLSMESLSASAAKQGKTLNEVVSTALDSTTNKFKAFKGQVQQSLEDIGVPLVDAGMKITAALTPIFTSFVTSFGDLINNVMGPVTTVIEGIADAFNALPGSIDVVVGALGLLVAGFAALKTLDAVSGIVNAFTGIINLLTGASIGEVAWGDAIRERMGRMEEGDGVIAQDTAEKLANAAATQTAAGADGELAATSGAAIAPIQGIGAAAEESEMGLAGMVEAGGLAAPTFEETATAASAAGLELAGVAEAGGLAAPALEEAGAAGVGAGAGLLGAGEGAAGLIAGLGGLAAVAGPLALVALPLLAIGLSSLTSEQSSAAAAGERIAASQLKAALSTRDYGERMSALKLDLKEASKGYDEADAELTHYNATIGQGHGINAEFSAALQSNVEGFKAHKNAISDDIAALEKMQAAQKKAAADQKAQDTERATQVNAIAEQYGVTIPKAINVSDVAAKSFNTGLNASLLEFGATATQTALDAGLFGTSLQNVAKGAAELKKSMDQNIASFGDVMTHFGNAWQISGQDIYAFQQDTLTKTQQWSTDLQTLMSTGIDNSLITPLEAAGPKSEAAVKGTLDEISLYGVDAVNATATGMAQVTATMNAKLDEQQIAAGVKAQETKAVISAAYAQMTGDGGAALEKLAHSSDTAAAQAAQAWIQFSNSIPKDYPPITMQVLTDGALDTLAALGNSINQVHQNDPPEVKVLAEKARSDTKQVQLDIDSLQQGKVPPDLKIHVQTALDDQKKLQDKIDETRQKQKPKVDIDVDGAKADVRSIQTAIDGIVGKTVSVVVNEVQGTKVKTASAHGMTALAAGGTVGSGFGDINTGPAGQTFNQPTFALIGEAGPESVLPLSRFNDMVDTIKSSGYAANIAEAAIEALGGAQPIASAADVGTDIGNTMASGVDKSVSTVTTAGVGVVNSGISAAHSAAVSAIPQGNAVGTVLTTAISDGVNAGATHVVSNIVDTIAQAWAVGMNTLQGLIAQGKPKAAPSAGGGTDPTQLAGSGGTWYQGWGFEYQSPDGNVNNATATRVNGVVTAVGLAAQAAQYADLFSAKTGQLAGTQGGRDPYDILSDREKALTTLAYDATQAGQTDTANQLIALLDRTQQLVADSKDPTKIGGGTTALELALTLHIDPTTGQYVLNSDGPLTVGSVKTVIGAM